jgi:hypothetical protein
LKVHFEELVGPLDEESGTNVKMKFGEALLFGLNSLKSIVD